MDLSALTEPETGRAVSGLTEDKSNFQIRWGMPHLI